MAEELRKARKEKSPHTKLEFESLAECYNAMARRANSWKRLLA